MALVSIGAFQFGLAFWLLGLFWVGFGLVFFLFNWLLWLGFGFWFGLAYWLGLILFNWLHWL